MTAGEIRDLIIVAFLIVIAVLAISNRMSLRLVQPVVPPVVSPQSQPLEGEVRDVRHRIANVEKQMPVVLDHQVRLRNAEREIAEIRGGMNAMQQSLGRCEHQINLLVEYQMERREKSS